MNYIILAIGLIGLGGFLALSPRMKVLIAFIVMSQGFDLVPPVIYGRHIWDYGAVLLLIAAAQLMFKKKTDSVKTPVFIVTLLVFIAWLIFGLFYSLFIYDYPLLDTFKMARQWIIGYLSVFIFLRLFVVDKDAFDILMKWLYAITFLLLIVAIVQNILRTPILFGLYREYSGTTRYLPSFLTLSLMFLWYIISRYFAAEPVKKHEYVYALMLVFVVATTYTRGLYIAVFFTFLAMLFFLFKKGKVKANASIGFIVVFTIGISALTASGALDRVIGRAASGLGLLFLENTASTKTDENTFTGRLLLAKERFVLVAEHNPVIGFGFIHENSIPKNIKRALKYGSVVYSAETIENYKYGAPYELALMSADIGWGNIVLVTGFVGFIVFIIFIGTFLVSYPRNKIDDVRMYHLYLAFYLQIMMLFLLMFNGSLFTSQVQIPGLMIAGYLYCANSRRNVKSGDRLSVNSDKRKILCYKKSQL